MVSYIHPRVGFNPQVAYLLVYNYKKELVICHTILEGLDLSIRL